MEKEDYPPKKYWNNCPFCNDRLINGCYYCTDPILDPDTKFEGRWYEHEARQNRLPFDASKIKGKSVFGNDKPRKVASASTSGNSFKHDNNKRDLTEFVENGN